MLEFSANLSMLYTELPFLDRFAAAARDGFTSVEYISPYESEPQVISDRLTEYGLSQALFNVPAGDWSKGERGVACLPDRVDEARSGVDIAIHYATALGCRQVNCLAGIGPAGFSRQVLEQVLIEYLRFAAPRMADAGIRLLLEPVNSFDIPGFFVDTTDQAMRIMEAVGSENLFLQLDFYHTQIMQGDLIRTFERLRDRVAHVQIADNPGRNEPGSGEINYPVIFSALEKLGYAGTVGCEYKPTSPGAGDLRWLRDYRSNVA